MSDVPLEVPPAEKAKAKKPKKKKPAPVLAGPKPDRAPRMTLKRWASERSPYHAKALENATSSFRVSLTEAVKADKVYARAVLAVEKAQLAVNQAQADKNAAAEATSHAKAVLAVFDQLAESVKASETAMLALEHGETPQT